MEPGTLHLRNKVSKKKKESNLEVGIQNLSTLSRKWNVSQAREPNINVTSPGPRHYVLLPSTEHLVHSIFFKDSAIKVVSLSRDVVVHSPNSSMLSDMSVLYLKNPFKHTLICSSNSSCLMSLSY